MTTDLPTSKFCDCESYNNKNMLTRFSIGLKEMLPRYLGELEGTGKWAIVDVSVIIGTCYTDCDSKLSDVLVPKLSVHITQVLCRILLAFRNKSDFCSK